MSSRQKKLYGAPAYTHIPRITTYSSLLRDACIGRKPHLIAERARNAMSDPRSQEQVDLYFGHWAVTSGDQAVIDEAHKCGASLRVETIEWMLYNINQDAPFNISCATQLVVEQTISRAMKYNRPSHVWRVLINAKCNISMPLINEIFSWCVFTNWRNTARLIETLISRGLEIKMPQHNATIKRAIYRAPYDAAAIIINSLNIEEISEMHSRDLYTWACSRRTDAISALCIRALAERGLTVYPRSNVLRNVLRRAGVLTLHALFDTGIAIDRYPVAVRDMINEAKQYI